MKHLLIASISAVALLAATPGGARSDQLYPYPGNRSDLSFSSDPEAIYPVSASQQLAPIAQKAAVELRLDAQKRVVVRDGLQKEQVSWQTLASDAPVQPGDVIRFVQSLNARSQRQVKNLVLTQPIPPRTVYILNSAAGTGKVTITYSTDSGKTYSATPEIEVRQPDGRVVRQPAPAANYTHIRWKFAQVTAPAAALATFQVAVN
ncbi:MAG: hypothetical protein KME26_33815 [Oscillatoria princeps RMCB-10]|jgi:uncharacterized repeat protein (TIGR01451 family)|nr:hypothetical protein [Oscillatoria princeps RMCB-10]